MDKGAYCYHKGEFIPVARHIDYYISLNDKFTLEDKSKLRLEGIERDKLISSYKDIARVRVMLSMTIVQCDANLAWEIIDKLHDNGIHVIKVIDFHLNMLYEGV